MKNQKSGFTLAEVLITLAIIGIVAAITLPNLLVNNQYKAIGVKLAKFLSTTEQATRATAAGEGNFALNSAQNISDFVYDTFLIEQVVGTAPTHTGIKAPDSNAENYLYLSTNGSAIPSNPTFELATTSAYGGVLKDGTRVAAALCTKPSNNGETNDIIDACNYNNESRGKNIVGGRKVGEPVFAISFDPAVSGIPKNVHHNYTFVVTELGFVYPAADEACLWGIYNDKFATTAGTFKEGSACYGTTRVPKKAS